MHHPQLYFIGHCHGIAAPFRLSYGYRWSVRCWQKCKHTVFDNDNLKPFSPAHAWILFIQRWSYNVQSAVYYESNNILKNHLRIHRTFGWGTERYRPRPTVYFRIKREIDRIYLSSLLNSHFLRICVGQTRTDSHSKLTIWCKLQYELGKLSLHGWHYKQIAKNAVLPHRVVALVGLLLVDEDRKMVTTCSRRTKVFRIKLSNCTSWSVVLRCFRNPRWNLVRSPLAIGSKTLDEGTRRSLTRRSNVLHRCTVNCMVRTIGW